MASLILPLATDHPPTPPPAGWFLLGAQPLSQMGIMRLAEQAVMGGVISPGLEEATVAGGAGPGWHEGTPWGKQPSVLSLALAQHRG